RFVDCGTELADRPRFPAQCRRGTMLDWHDIQGNILRGYPRHPYARFMPFHLRSPDSGRNFLRELGPLITRGHWGDDPPKATTNAGSTRIGALRHQDAAWLIVNGKLCRNEHFGFLDGISNPDIEGVPDNGRRQDVGNPDADGNFRKLPVGEFLLGYPGEGGEV